MEEGELCYARSVADSINLAVESVLEDIQKAQVDCGGAFFRRQEIAKMSVEELLRLLIPNSVEFNVKYKGE